MVNLPNFGLRRARLEPVTFRPVEKVFRAQVQVKALKDINGWASRRDRVRWQMKDGRTYFLDEDTAREFAIKGYVHIVYGDVRPASDDERAEILSTVTTIGLGG